MANDNDNDNEEHRMTPEQAAQLRAKFPDEAIGVLPRATKKDNPKGTCKVCGGYHGLPAVHLSYVGHAAVTDRLLAVDPEWTWAPLATDDVGNPVMIRNDRGQPVAFWITMTVAGVTRPGVGSIDAGAFEPEKQLISDAIRNAAMRFGVALDLWAKEDLTAVADEAEAERDWFIVNGWDGGVDEHNDRRRRLLESLKSLPTEAKEAFRVWREAEAIDVRGNMTYEQMVLAEDQAAELAPQSAPEPPMAQSEPEPAAMAPGANGGPPEPTSGECSVCGSTRTQLVTVEGVVRCAKAKDCEGRAGVAQARMAMDG